MNIEYEALNEALIRQIKTPPRKVMDFGCGIGSLGSFIKKNWGAEVTGITYSEAEAEKARNSIDHVEVCDLNDWIPNESQKFDLVICSHVLEHLYQPKKLLFKIKSILAPGGILLVALPNVLFWRQRLLFLKGVFRYTDGGLMDSTHFRFFDYQTAQELITISGYHIMCVEPDGVVPIGFLRRKLPIRWVKSIDQWGLRKFPGIVGCQILIEAKAEK
ncbi:MAG: class I SAM-dependent methyltransferase [Verrucomicrobiota bacterium]